MATNNNSGTPFSSVSAYNSNISLMARRFASDGGFLSTDSNAASAYCSYVEIQLNSGAVQFKYYNTLNQTLSTGVLMNTLSAASLT